MHHVIFAISLAALATAAHAAEWRVSHVNAPARVNEIEMTEGQTRVKAGGLWYKIVPAAGRIALVFIDKPEQPQHPDGALPDSRIATGTRDIARAWLAEPTTRYNHGILGDKIESGALVIEARHGKRHIVRLEDDAVFEDLEPRLADLDRDGHDEIIVVKSYLRRGSALAVIGLRKGKYKIVTETPPLGGPHRWLDPGGIADFSGDGKTAIVLVRQPHVIGSLELWSWTGNTLRNTAELPDIANHIAGTRAIDMAAVADFDGDKVPDIAAPSLDRSRLRIVSFAPKARQITSVPLPAKAVTNLGLVADGAGPPAIALGLADGSLVVVRRVP